MICWSCRKEIPNEAKFCPHCEAEAVEEPSKEEIEAAKELLAGLDPTTIGEFRKLFENSSTGEEFVNQIMIGNCPKCGSSKTSHCENDPEIDDPCVARCFDCGQLWCPDCGDLFPDIPSAQAHDCPAWEDFDFDIEDE